MTDAPDRTRRVLLARRPKGAPVPEDFRLDEAPLPELQPGEALVRTIWLSLDPYMRGRMNDGPSYAAPVQLGEPMQGECVGEVVASRADGLAPGYFVRGHGGWQSRFVLPAAKLTRLDPTEAPQLWRNILTKRLLVQGMIVYDHGELEPEFRRTCAPWVRSGQLRFKEDVVQGLENAPAAFIGMLEGRNFGKLLVQVGPDPTR